jgi:hypothetical protein
VKVRILSPAVEEIAAAASWFESKRPGLGSEFWEHVEQELKRIEDSPRSLAKSEFATPTSDIRYALIGRFNYVIHCLIEASEVQVISVAHASRKPGYWRVRAKES